MAYVQDTASSSIVLFSSSQANFLSAVAAEGDAVTQAASSAAGTVYIDASISEKRLAVKVTSGTFTATDQLSIDPAQDGVATFTATPELVDAIPAYDRSEEHTSELQSP